MGYTNTFIAVAEDCRATTGEAPPQRAGSPTVAAVQHAMLATAPGRWTQEDILLASSPAVRGRQDLDAEQLERLREEYFAQPRACLRASPLPKTYGWGLHYDDQGRITLHPVDSAEYARLRDDPTLTQLRAMRSAATPHKGSTDQARRGLRTERLSSHPTVTGDPPSAPGRSPVRRRAPG